jgi:DNA processing protein
MGAPKPVTLEDLILLAHAHAPLAAGVPAPAVLARSLARLQVRAWPRDDPAYPAGWRDLEDAPPVCFVRGGSLPAVADAVAIVGSRAASAYGLAVARHLAGDLADAGIVVVSGLARGIDGAAHEGALDRGGHTIAVLPSGIDTITPHHHADLATRIAARGALVSERASGGAGGGWGFVTRNRLIAAMTVVTVVVEASTTSGALHTARAAKRLGRIVMTVPGDVERDTALGCAELLREGAGVCVTAADVLRVMTRAVPGRPVASASPAPASVRVAASGVDPTPVQRVARALQGGAWEVETIAAAAGLAVGETLAHLLALEWSGVAQRAPGGRWRAATRTGRE